MNISADGNAINMRKGDDFHVHFRLGALLRQVAHFTASQFRRALAMPNTTPPILTGHDACAYQFEIMKALRQTDYTVIGEDAFTPLMAIKLTMATTPEMVREARKFGVVAAKLYPEGVTTNSSDGVNLNELEKLHAVFEAMQEVGMVLCLHGEVPGLFVLVREAEFLRHVQYLTFHFPELKIVLEHVTTADAVNLVMESSENVAATITLHHLLITLNDVLCFKGKGGEGLNPHHYCKPVAKTPLDRGALVRAATSGNPRFFFGSDTAPHLVGNKESGCCSAGVWSAPVALSRLVQFFEEQGALEKLEPFVSEFGAQFYGLPLNTETIPLVKRPWVVPDCIDVSAPEVPRSSPVDTGVVPFLAEQTINWQIVH